MNHLPLVQLLNNASSQVDIISSNEDRILGLDANLVLACINRNCKIRYVQSKINHWSNRPIVDKILYEFGEDAKLAYVYNNTEHSLVVVDGKRAFCVDDCSMDNPESILDFELQIDIASERFEKIWNENYNSPKIRSVKDAINTMQYSGLEAGNVVFRGQPNSEWSANPSLFRKYDNPFQVESDTWKPLLVDKHALNYLNTFDPLEYFAIFQHYGAATRLLDFTRDILIGLFFACYDKEGINENYDGKLYALEYSQFTRLHVNSSEAKIFRQRPTQENVYSFLGRMYVTEPSFFEPLIKHPRLRLQAGLFLIFPMSKDNSHFKSLEEYNRSRNSSIANEDEKFWLAYKLVDKSFKKAILEELRVEHGISEETVFFSNENTKTMGEEIKNLQQKYFIK